MTYLHPHEREELEVAFGPRLWDATPGVCCEYFQLGACAHTESFEPYEDELTDDDGSDWEYRFAAWSRPVPAVEDDEPF